MNMGEKITFNQLFDKVNFIEVPIIQRDYAQGRKEQSEVRHSFLDSLLSALMIDRTNGDKHSLNLDFVYGSIDDTNTLSILDGQQRLTTLFLLHWFLALKHGHLTEFKSRFSREYNSRFTYKTRPSSSEFFDALVSNDSIEQRYHAIAINTDNETKPSSLTTEYTIDQLITDSTWFFSAWQQDPTVQACLNMLRSIEDKFKHTDIDLYQRITDNHDPYITFQFLPLNTFGLSDELYIKMNARGKPLTPFENFKANLQQVIKSYSNELPSYELVARGGIVNGYDYFIHKIDTDWADLFWHFRNLVSDDASDNTYDDELMNFIRLIILYQYLLNNSITSKEVSKDGLATLLGSKSMLPAVSISKYKELQCLNPEFATRLIDTLDMVYSPSPQLNNFKTYILNNEYYDELALFKQVLKNDTNYTEKLRFFAFYTYIDSHKTTLDLDEAKQWTRVIYNLTENTVIDSSDTFYRAFQGINSLIQIKRPILDILKEDIDISGFLGDQVLEERIKAHLLGKSKQWESAVLQAEKHPFFKGQIGFLLNFSGVLSFYREHAHCHWSEHDDNLYLSQFKKYTASASAVFDLIGNSSSRINYLWERSVLSKGVYFTKKGSDRYNLLSTRLVKNNIERDHSWKRLLRISSDIGKSRTNTEPKQVFVKSVLDDPDFDHKKIPHSLKRICNKAIANGSLENWRKYFIKYPQLFKLCRQGFILKNNDEFVLFKESQRNHTQYELYSYVTKIRLSRMKSALAPFNDLHYQEVISSEIPASLKISGWDFEDTPYSIEIKRESKSLNIYFYQKTSAPYPAPIEDILTNSGFEYILSDPESTSSQGYFVHNQQDTVDGIINKLKELCKALRTLHHE